MNNEPNEKTIYQQLFEKVKKSIAEGLKHIKPQRKRDIIARALSFSRVNKNILVIIADPKTDNVIATYNNQYAAARVGISKYLHLNNHIIKALIERSEDEKELNKKTSEFLQFVDAFLFKLSTSIKVAEKTKNNKLS